MPEDPKEERIMRERLILLPVGISELWSLLTVLMNNKILAPLSNSEKGLTIKKNSANLSLKMLVRLLQNMRAIILG